MSLGLSYLMLFDSQRRSFIQASNTPTTTTTNTRTASSAREQMTTRQLFSPQQLIIATKGKLYDAGSSLPTQQLVQTLTTTPIEITEQEIVTSSAFYETLSEMERLEWVYATAFPVTLLDHMVRVQVDGGLNFQVDRLIIPHDEEDDDEVYFVNSQEQTVLKAKLPKDTIQQLWQQATTDKMTWKVVEPIVLKESVAYVPIEPTEWTTQDYLLERIPESQYIADVFPTTNFRILDTKSQETRTLSNHEFNLTLNSVTQSLDLEINLSKSSELDSSEKKLRETVKMMNKYEAWNDMMRFDGIQFGKFVYRRYLKGVPIVSHLSVDYSQTTIDLRTNIKQKYKMPLLVLYAPLSDLNTPVTLSSKTEIEQIFAEAGFHATDFDRLFVAYEWQEEMENFQRVTLIPKWHVEKNGVIYPLEMVQNGELSQLLNDGTGR